jgi:hypothetical protein
VLSPHVSISSKVLRLLEFRRRIHIFGDSQTLWLLHPVLAICEDIRTWAETDGEEICAIHHVCSDRRGRKRLWGKEFSDVRFWISEFRVWSDSAVKGVWE